MKVTGLLRIKVKHRRASIRKNNFKLDGQSLYFLNLNMQEFLLNQIERYEQIKEFDYYMKIEKKCLDEIYSQKSCAKEISNLLTFSLDYRFFKNQLTF